MKNKDKIVILAAENAEYEKCKEYLKGYECILMGVGAGNVINTCKSLPKGTKVINVGYAGSNKLPVGTVSAVNISCRLIEEGCYFADYNNPFKICNEGNVCYTGNSFVTESDITQPVLYDMELNYIASFVPSISLIASVKIVSDNLSIDAFRNNAIRESGVLNSDEVWKRVAETVKSLIK